jgi:aminopeptidase N
MELRHALRLAGAMAFASFSFLSSAQSEAPGFRLGDVAAPVSYRAQLAIDPREAEFTGEVRIELKFSRATPRLWLNATNLTIESAEFTQGGRKIEVTAKAVGEDHVSFDAKGDPFVAGPATAAIRYRGRIDPVGTEGLFRQQDNGDWYVFSQFEATSARLAIPCFDEPGWKTPWRIVIDAPSGNEVVSNTPEIMASDAPGRAGWTRHDFATTKPLPSYLIAFAVGPFDVVDGGTAGVNKTPLRYYAPKGRGAEARFVKESTPKLLELLEQYFGIPYPFEKLDAVAVPQTVGFGAMENVGMITYATNLLLATPREETGRFRQVYAYVASHEIAHMWFGNLVTLAWWDDVWLNEAFATWIETKIIAGYRAEWDNGTNVGRARDQAIHADRLASARRIHNPVVVKSDVENAFDSITYEKGMAVLSMFEAWFGPDKFREGVRLFMKRHEYGSATSADFARALSEASGRGETATKAFAAFIEQPGIPLIDVSMKCGRGSAAIEVSQRRFRPVGSAAAEIQWTTPVCFRYPGAAGPVTRCEDVANGSREISLGEQPACPAWVVANSGGRSHYMPRYDAPLSRQLREHIDVLSANEAVALLVDVAHLSESGLMPHGDAFAWADAAFAHPSPIVRMWATTVIRRQRDEWLTPAQARAKRDVVARRVQPLARELGWLEKEGESDEVRQLRPVLLSFAAEVDGGEALRAQARELAMKWLDNRDAVPATTTQAVLETAGRFADEATYARLEAAAAKREDRRERGYLMSALSKVRDAKLRARAMDATLKNAAINGRDARQILDNALGDDTNRRPTTDFVLANFTEVTAKLPRSSATRLMFQMSGLCTREERDRFRDFFKDRAAASEGGPLVYKQSLESIELCVAARNQ